MNDATLDQGLTADLVTVRDWLRYAVTRFERAGLVFGHGTSRALDEAAFLLLASLELPIDDIAPWLDCRLTRGERQQIAALIDARIATRKPAPYLVNQAWIGPHRFHVDERVIVPRSFIGELLVRGGLQQMLPDADGVANVLELCTGSGCLAIIAALEFPDASVTALDLSADALEVARLNVARYDLADRISLLSSDIFDALPPQRFDLIIANPPYVTDDAVASFPPEYQAEPVMAHAGGADGLDLVHKILAGAPQYLAPGGSLVVEIGQARLALEEARPDLPFIWLETEESEGEVFLLSAEDLTPAASKLAAPKARRKGSET